MLALVGAQAHSIDSLKELAVKTTAGGAPVRVGDVAAVEPGVLPVYTAVRADNRPAVLLNIARQPSSNTVTVADEVAAEVAQTAYQAAGGGRDRAILRPVGDRAREHQERARCDPDRACAGMFDPVSFPWRLAFFTDRGAGDSGDGGGDGACAVVDRRELQPDDAGWAGRGDRAGDRRCDCGGGEHCLAPRRGGSTCMERGAEGAAGDHASADRIDHYAGGCFSTADRGDGSYGQLLSRACHYDGGCAAYFAGARGQLYASLSLLLLGERKGEAAHGDAHHGAGCWAA